MVWFRRIATIDNDTEFSVMFSYRVPKGEGVDYIREADSLLFQTAGRKSDGSGFLPHTRVRDHEWIYRTQKAAERMLSKFHRAGINAKLFRRKLDY